MSKNCVDFDIRALTNHQSMCRLVATNLEQSRSECSNALFHKQTNKTTQQCRPTRTTFASNVQKQELRDHSASTPSMTQRELAEWAVTTFKLAHPPSPAAKTNRSVCRRQLEEELLLWIAKREELQLPAATSVTICEKAARIREKIVAAAPQTDSKTLMAMAFSNGWLCKFQTHHNLTSKRVHGEAASVNMDAVDEGRAFLQRITSGYARRDIFNFDETGYFYCTPPSKAISARPVSGRKNAKKGVTVAVACNADGTTKLPLLFVGTSKQPRCFGGKSSAELGFGYVSTPKAWMNTQLFQSWVNQFNESMRREPSRFASPRQHFLASNGRTAPQRQAADTAAEHNSIPATTRRQHHPAV